MMNQNFGISDSGMNEEVTPTEILRARPGGFSQQLATAQLSSQAF